MSKIIIIEQKNIVVCDNVTCDHVVPNMKKDLSPPTSEELSEYINKPCPKCGENLLTMKDYEDFMSLVKTVKWANKWFGWLGFFFSVEKYEYKHVKIHNGIHISDE